MVGVESSCGLDVTLNMLKCQFCGDFTLGIEFEPPCSNGLAKLAPAVSPMSAAPACDAEKKFKKQKWSEFKTPPLLRQAE